MNGKSYIGSSINLNKRLSDYYSVDRFKRTRTRDNSLISKAILKYKIYKFKLDILEYCDKNVTTTREQYYLDLLRPEYNILKMAGSTFGHRLSEEAKNKLSIRTRGKGNPMYGKCHTEETKFNMSINNRGINNPMYGKCHTKLKIKMSIIRSINNKSLVISSMLGKHHTKETKKNISESNKLF